MIGQIANIITDTPRGIVYVFLCVVLSTYYLFLKCRRDPRLVEFAKTIKGSDGLPLVGNSLQFAFGGLDTFGKTCATYSEKYGSVYKIWLGNELVIGLSEIDHIKVILRNSKAIDKPRNLFMVFHDFGGNALFVTSSSVWRQARKKLQPIFGRNIMKFQIPKINNSIDIFMKLFENHLDGPEFNIYEYIPYLVAHAFLNSFIGVNLTYKETKYYGFHTILKQVGVEAVHTIIKPWRRMHFIKQLVIRRTDAYKRTLEEFFEFLLVKSSSSEEIDRPEGKNEPNNVTNFLLTATQELEKEMKLKNYSFDETMATITASTDTTSTTISFLLLMIAIYPEIQEKLNEERCQVFGVDGIPSNIDDLDKCKYLDQVFKETLRRFTIVPCIFRYTEEDIEVGSMVIPAGVAVMVRVGDIHMNPHIYPNPDKFNPDNFCPEAVDQRSKYSFLPFSIGSRDCIGRIFAESTIKLVIIAILRNFKLSTTTKMEEIEYEPGFVIGKRGGYQLSITSRN